MRRLGMGEAVTIASADNLDGHSIVVVLSDGRTMTFALEDLLSLGVAATLDPARPT